MYSGLCCGLHAPDHQAGQASHQQSAIHSCCRCLMSAAQHPTTVPAHATDDRWFSAQVKQLGCLLQASRGKQNQTAVRSVAEISPTALTQALCVECHTRANRDSAYKLRNMSWPAACRRKLKRWNGRATLPVSEGLAARCFTTAQNQGSPTHATGRGVAAKPNTPRLTYMRAPPWEDSRQHVHPSARLCVTSFNAKLEQAFCSRTTHQLVQLRLAERQLPCFELRALCRRTFLTWRTMEVTNKRWIIRRVHTLSLGERAMHYP